MRACAWMISAVLLGGGAPVFAAEPDDLSGARAVFEKNIDAIGRRDQTAYLACYRRSDRLAITGPEGFKRGYAALTDDPRGPSWPDTYDASDLRLDWLREGVVYGTYRYRVRYGGDEHAGISERLFLDTEEGWRILVTTAFDAPPGTPPPPRAIAGATLVDGTGRPPVGDSVVVMRNGEIDCAGSRADCPIPEGVEIVDGKGLWMTPGLVDAHVHFSQTGWADGRPDALDVRSDRPYETTVAELAAKPERFFRSDLCSGVTAVFDVGGYPWTLSLSARAQRDPRAPHVGAAGPLLSTVAHWVNLPAERQFIPIPDAASAREGVVSLASAGAAAVKVWYIVSKDHPVESSAAAVEEAGKEARAKGLRLIVHATGLAEAKEALKAGAAMLVHSVDDLPVDAEFLEAARRNKIVYCPTLTVVSGYLGMFEAAAQGRAPAVDDPNGCVDPATLARVRETARWKAAVTPERLDRLRDRVARIARVATENLRAVVRAGITIAMGTDAGNPLTLHGPSVYAEMEAMQKAGMSPMEVLVASTRGGAQALGMEKKIGTVEKGKTADLLLLMADPTRDVAHFRRLSAVVRAGVVRSLGEWKAIVAATP